MANSSLHAILFCCVLLALGLALRAGVRWIQILYIPAAAIAGLLGFACVQVGLHVPAMAASSAAIAKELSGWPGWLIAVVFAGLLLERSSDKTFAVALKRGARSGILAWIIILGQIAIGLAVYMTVVRPMHPEITASFSQLLEVSWAGGHGSSAAMAEVYRAKGFAQGRDLAFFLATVGLIYGVLSGLVLVNIAARRGWTATAGTANANRATDAAIDFSDEPRPVAFGRVRSEVMEPMAVQVILLMSAFGVGYAMQQAFIAASAWMMGQSHPAGAQALSNIPLFLFTLIGGWLIRTLLQAMRIGSLIDNTSIHRLVGVSIEFLIVAAISSMRVETLSTFWVPVVMLIVLAGAWCAFALVVLARRLLPPAYWFELGLLNYGFSTANTPQGMMLLRIVDPELKTGAAEDYAIAAPLSAPFIGGGIVTIAVLPAILDRVRAEVVSAVIVGAIVALYWAGRTLGKHDRGMRDRSTD